MKAKVFCEKTENEYIEIERDEHRCKTQKYDPEKYQKLCKFVLPLNFEIRSKMEYGKGKKQLIIFDGDDKTKCFIYQYNTHGNYFVCNGCKNRNVYAKLAQNSDGEDYIILSPTEHTCSSRPYIQESEEIIIRSPNFKYLEKSAKGPPKLFIFDPKDKNLSYVFSPVYGAKKSNRFQCQECTKQEVEREKFIQRMDGREVKGIVTVELCEEDNGIFFVRTNKNQKHLCFPQKYQPEKYEPKKPMDPKKYFYFRSADSRKALYIAVYYPEDRTLCYQLCYNKTDNRFKCSYCSSHHGKTTSAKHHFDQDGNEYIVSLSENHLCKPFKVGTLKQSGIKILKASGIPFIKESIKSKEKDEEIDKSRIIKAPNFELRLKIDKNEEKYVILGQNNHICEPFKYKPQNEIIEAPNFAIFNKDDKKKPTKLIIFISPEKDRCYQFTFHNSNKSFRCNVCFNIDKKNIVTAKICQYSNGEEYVQMITNGHICTPKSFVLEEFIPKVVPSTRFKIFDGGRGRPNTRLVVFDKEKKDFVYDYKLDQRVYYTCEYCKKTNVTVIAKLQENDNGEKYLELGTAKHVCKPRKFDPQVYKKARLTR
uniref:Uncharacterized protein n=1 Tax=Panagrolaimus sp. ES5 TaxID=591445 RepID=A0AC34G3B9_9BILA